MRVAVTVERDETTPSRRYSLSRMLRETHVVYCFRHVHKVKVIEGILVYVSAWWWFGPATPKRRGVWAGLEPAGRLDLRGSRIIPGIPGRLVTSVIVLGNRSRIIYRSLCMNIQYMSLCMNIHHRSLCMNIQYRSLYMNIWNT